jgi:hypothetical protein
MWRWLVGHRLLTVREALAGEGNRAVDDWLASREHSLTRERDALLLKMDRLAGRIAEAADVDPLQAELQRLVSDLHRHRQRLNDLVYDTLALDLGGSE